MPGVSPRLSADQIYPCTICGTPGSVVRDAPDLADKRVKCADLRCSYVYSAADSLSAKEAGAIPDGPPSHTSEETNAGRTSEDVQPSGEHESGPSDLHRPPIGQTVPTGKAPRTPSFVILSKDRTESEFCTKKNLRGRVIVWTAQEKKFDVFELTPKKVQAKLSIQ